MKIQHLDFDPFKLLNVVTSFKDQLTGLLCLLTLNTNSNPELCPFSDVFAQKPIYKSQFYLFLLKSSLCVSAATHRLLNNDTNTVSSNVQFYRGSLKSVVLKV